MKVCVENISFAFENNKFVLNNVSFKSNGDNTIAIVGPSGCGKSTLLRLLSGMIQKNSKYQFEGSIFIEGTNASEYVKSGKVGFMFQEPALFPNLTVKENISLPTKLKNNKFSHNLDKIIETVGLKEFVDYLPNKLSGGMKTRVALARTFITQPQLLLLDEPFSALDVKWKFILYRELELLRQSYSPLVIIVTHDIQEALLLSNHVLVFGGDGRISEEIQIEKSLPRVFETDAIKGLQSEYLQIQDLIMNH